MGLSFKRGRRKLRVEPLNLTPLIDINANLMFFMMISASVAEDKLEAGDRVELPASSSRKAQAGDLVSVVVGLDHVSVNEIEIAKLKKGAIEKKDFLKKKDRFKPLFRELTTRFKKLIAKGAQPGAGEGKDDLPVVLVQADRLLPYRTLKVVMRTCGQAGFTRFRFAAKEMAPR